MNIRGLANKRTIIVHTDMVYAGTLRHLHFEPGHLMGSTSSYPITVPENLVKLGQEMDQWRNEVIQ